MVAGKQEALLGGVPQGEGEEAAQTEEAVVAPLGICFQQDFRVRLRFERMSLGLKLFAKRLEIVDVAVEDDDIAVFSVFHGLRSGGREVENGKAVMPEDDFWLSGDDESVLRVWSTMLHVLHHGLDAFQMAVLVLWMEEA